MKTANMAVIAKLGCALALAWMAGPLWALGLQIPQIDGCTKGVGAADTAVVNLEARKDNQHAGTFRFRGKIGCTPPGYGGGTMTISIDMSDSSIQGDVTLTTFDYVVSYGKHTPTFYSSGRCKFGNMDGCRYWLIMTDNVPSGKKGDIAGFLILDGKGNRAAYGTGMVVDGDIKVQPE